MRILVLLSCVAVWSGCEPVRRNACGESAWMCKMIPLTAVPVAPVAQTVKSAQKALVLECFGGTDLCGDSCADLQIDQTTAVPAVTPVPPIKSAKPEAVGCPVWAALPTAQARVNTTSDPSYCGACDTMCVGPQRCVESQYFCEANLSICGGVCVNTQTDLKHCGACDNTCAGDGVCVDVCSLVCVGGTTDCNNTCVNTAIDANHCGACGQACAWNELCFEGNCTAPEAYAQRRRSRLARLVSRWSV